MSNWTIRAANLEDAEGLRNCMLGAYSAYAERMANDSLPPLEADYAEEIENFPTWVAESDDSIVGGLIMCFDEDRATLSNIAVDPDFQGHGLGRGLLDFAESEAKRQGFNRLQLATHELLTENLAIYKHLGWNETARDGGKVFFEKNLS
ncbi:MAG: GNAT family N-acetyltransferase [Pseudomonadales bacterium]|nr:GNAT family N-acetyltransferase [Pseudomonadales bacterium]